MWMEHLQLHGVLLARQHGSIVKLITVVSEYYINLDGYQNKHFSGNTHTYMNVYTQ